MSFILSHCHGDLYKGHRLLSIEKMVRTIKIEELGGFYKTGVAAKSQKWLDHTLAAQGVAAAAKSDAAETQYAAKVNLAITNKLRQKGLAAITDEDIKAGVRAAGAGGYSTGAQRKADKFQKKFARFAARINSVLPTLPAKTTDPLSNLANRAGPIVTALHDEKLKG